MAWLDQVLGPLEIALNRALALSPEARAQLAGSADPVGLYFRDLGWGLRLFPTAQGVQLMAGVEGVRALTSTSLVGMARLLAGEDPRTMGSALGLEGDAEYAERIMAALRTARIDLAGELRGLVGSVLGDGPAQGLRSLLDGGRASLRSLLLGGAGQGRDVPASAALAEPEPVRHWMDEVDEAVTELDRLQARIERLERRRGQA